MLHALPAIPYDTDEIVPAVVTPHADRVLTAIVTRCHQRWRGSQSAFVPTVTKFASCTRAIWQLSTSTRTSKDN